MNSPCRAHFERVSAALSAASAAPGESLAGASRYELMLAKLATDRQRLHSIKSIERKIAVKREVLPEYAGYVAGSLEGGRGAQDDVLTTIMLWRIDAGDFAGALAIAEYALTHRLTLPDSFDRSTATVVAEEFAEQAIIALKANQPFDVDQLKHVADLTESHDMPDQVRAKLYKALGLASQDKPEVALLYLNRALKLHDRVGVKLDIDRLQKQLGNLATGSDAGGGN